MPELPVQIFDTTLRDDAHNSGLPFSPEDELRLIRQLERVGFDANEISFGGPTQGEPVPSLAGNPARVLKLLIIVLYSGSCS